jgi:hypothetical protein
MTDDEIKIIRQARHEISAECGHDVDRVVAYYQRVKEELKQTGEFRFARSTKLPESRQEPSGGSPAAETRS